MKTPSQSPKIEMVFLYYDNPQMLKLQIDCWNSYAGVLRSLPGVILIDDGSPHIPAVNIVKKHRCALPIKIYRINEDIPWNFTGARNLGCKHATDWIYMSDIDTILTELDAQKLFADHPLDRRCYYKPRVMAFPDHPVNLPGNVNFLYHKETYENIGGYDEDYAGNYGRGDTDFMNRLRRSARRVLRSDVFVRVVNSSQIPDASTRGRPRDKTKNIELYLQKQAAGFVPPVNPLRFTWQRVY